MAGVKPAATEPGGLEAAIAAEAEPSIFAGRGMQRSYEEKANSGAQEARRLVISAGPALPARGAA